MNNPATSPLSAAIRAETRKRFLIPALLVAGSSLAVAPAAALELGEASVMSALGQPLAASIPFALGPNERLDSSCVGIGGGTGAAGLPAVNRADINIANGRITVTGKGVISEPIVALRLSVNCPYTPRLTREYMLFVDPARPIAASRPAQAAAEPRQAAVAPRAESRPPAAEPARPVAQGVRYRVQPGESLSAIVARIEDRPVGLWAAVTEIFEANPEAFIDSDPNKLKAGAWLTIPDFIGSTVAATEPVATFAPADTADPGVSASRAGSPDASSSEAAADPAMLPEAPGRADAASPVSDVSASSAASTASTEVTATPAREPAVAADLGNTAGAPSAVPEPGPALPAAAAPVPAGSAAAAPGADAESGGLVGWLLGGAVALIGGLLLMSRRIRATFGSTPVGPVEVPRRRKTDTGTGRLEAASRIEVEETEIKDNSPTHENPLLDADLELGSGFADDADVEVAQDFGFSATTHVDFELPEEMSSGDTGETRSTDIIPPLNFDVESILENEVLPGEDDDEYDMSVIVDATKMPSPEDVTERDLGAIDVTTDEDSPEDSDYLVDEDTVYELLEQDYEDELTATQALNQEIAKAAAELNDRLREAPVAAEEDLQEEDGTAEYTLTGSDKTMELPADDGTVEMSVAEPDGTAELPVDDGTAELPVDDGTAEMPLATVTRIDEATARLPAGGDDDADETAVLPGKHRSRP